MKASSIILLIIGILGLIASIYNWYTEDSISRVLLSLICSVSLIWGAFELKKKDKNKC